MAASGVGEAMAHWVRELSDWMPGQRDAVDAMAFMLRGAQAVENAKQERRNTIMRRLAYVVISLFWLGEILLLSQAGAWQVVAGFTVFEFAQFALATFRLGRLMAFDKVFETYRLPFTKTVPDGTGAGDTTDARHEGFWGAFGELLSCPICSGTHGATVLMMVLTLFPGFGRITMMILAAAGVLELLNSVVEFFDWKARMSRYEAGGWERSKKSPYYRSWGSASLDGATRDYAERSHPRDRPPIE